MNKENIETLNKLYESLKLLCYQFPNFISDFEIEFIKKTDDEKFIFNRVQTELKNCLSDLFNTSEIVFNIINSDNVMNLNQLLTTIDGGMQ